MKKEKTMVIVIIIAVFAIISCSSDRKSVEGPGSTGGGNKLEQTTAETSLGYNYEQAIVFSEVDGKELKLDIAYPKNVTVSKPCVMFLIGGGFHMCSRQGFTSRVKEGVKKDYVTLTIDYRTAPKYHFPEPLKDVQQALKWIHTNSRKYGIDTDRIALVGLSAGATIALMSAFVRDLPGSDFTRTPEADKICAVISLAGPTDFIDYGPDTLIGDYLGKPLEGNEALYEIASPINHISPDNPPVLSIHGAIDEIVPVRQAIAFDKKMKKAGADHTLLIKKEGRHMIWEEAVWEYLAEHFK